MVVWSGGAGHVAFIERVTADGIAYRCLFAAPGSGLDLRPWLQPGQPSEALTEAISDLWRERADRYSEERGSLAAMARANAQARGPAHAEMAYLGG